MKLGAFSVSLSVKDLKISKAFYEELGFSVFAGELERNYLIMKNENALIGLFQGMFESNILTFNPGWNESAEQLDSFESVQEIEKRLLVAGVNIVKKTENEHGPDSLVITDPDGNTILLDQHV